MQVTDKIMYPIKQNVNNARTLLQFHFFMKTNK